MVAGLARDGLTELRRGVLEHCVLAVVCREETYAFDIVRTLAGAGGLVTSEGTIYPLLARLRAGGLVTTTWRESDVGPPRRYYRMTPAGINAHKAFIGQWRQFRDAVDRLLGDDAERRGDGHGEHDGGQASDGR
jgi:PadR family transcriptional regulator PadR